MAFPVVAATNTTADTDGTTTAVNMPASISAGDLLMVFVAHDSSTAVTQSGGSDWTRLDQASNGTAVQLAVFAKIAAGGDTLTIAGAAQDTAVVSARITGHGVSNVSVDIMKGTIATGTSAAPDPPSVTHGGPQDYLVIECAASDDDDDTATYWSTNYSAVNQVQSASSTSSVLISVGQRSVNGTSEDPGAMALAASEEWLAQTYSIPPALPTFYTKYQDDFTRADNADLGSEWDAGYTSRNALKIVSNEIQSTTLNTESSETENAYAAPDNQWASITLGSWTGSVQRELSILLRGASPSTATWVEFDIDANGSFASQISDRVNGTRTGLASENASTFTAGDVIRAIAIGTRYTIQKNSVSMCTAVSGTITSGSRVGCSVFVSTSGALTNAGIASMKAGDFVPYTLTCSAGSYALTGTDAGLLLAAKLAADVGVYDVTGQGAGLFKGSYLSADGGVYDLTGTDADLLYVPISGYTLSCDAGSYALAGTDCSFLVTHILSADPGAYDLTGQDSGLLFARIFNVDAGTYDVVGLDASLLRQFTLVAGSGDYALAGTDASLLRAALLSADPGQYFLIGDVAGLSWSGEGAPTANGYLLLIRRRRRW